MKKIYGFVMLSLLPFFQFFRPDNPYHLASIKELEDSLPDEMMNHDASWIEIWKAGGFSQKSVVPYFHQLDFFENGSRRCGDASAAMVAMFYGVVDDAETYGWVREEFGDTTQAHAHVRTLKSLGLNASFVQNADDSLIEAEISSGRPVIVGWLHIGSIEYGKRPTCDRYGCGHYSVIVGYEGSGTNDSKWIMHDPSGEPDIEKGGHISNRDAIDIRVSRDSFRKRWQVEGKGTGWAILVDNE